MNKARKIGCIETVTSSGKVVVTTLKFSFKSLCLKSKGEAHTAVSGGKGLILKSIFCHHQYRVLLFIYLSFACLC